MEQSAVEEKVVICQAGTFKLHQRTGKYTCDEENNVTATYDDHSDQTCTSQFIFPQNHATQLPRDLPPCDLDFDICGPADIVNLIGQSRDPNDFFLLPSQLNGAEYPSSGSIVQNIKSYCYDNTGGPAGQLSVHPGLGQFILDNAHNLRSKGTGINSVKDFLEVVNKVGCDLRLVNGYLKVPRNDPENLKECVKAVRENLHLIRIPGFLNAMACGLMSNRRTFSDFTHKVNMLYGSAIPVGTYGNSFGSFTQHVAYEIRVAQYFAGVQAAYHRQLAVPDQVVNIYLMNLGGGVFRNSRQSIVDSVYEALDILNEVAVDREMLKRLQVHLIGFSMGEADDLNSKVARARILRHGNANRLPNELSDDE